MDYLAPETLDHGIDGFVEVVPGTQCRPVALRGHMAADGGGYVPENDQWFDVLTETLSGRRVGRDPLTVPLGVLRKSGHGQRDTRAVVAAYRAGMQMTVKECPKARTYKELRRVVCAGCAENMAEVRRCAVTNCPIWPYRMGRNPHNPRRGKNPFA